MSLDKIRQEIDQIDEQMKILFLQRMDLAKQVIEEKKKTGAAVYVPEREAEIIEVRSEGAPEEYLPECRAFFKQMMGISRTYQYSRIAGQAETLKVLTEGKDSVVLEFSCGMECGGLAACLNAVSLAGLQAESVKMENFFAWRFFK